MYSLRPEAGAGPGGGVQARLRLALAESLRARDTIAVSALRSALGAIGNAEAERRRLSAAEIEQIVRGEAGEREGAARDYEQAGHADRAGRLRREAQVLLAVLADEDRPAGDRRDGAAGDGRSRMG